MTLYGLLFYIVAAIIIGSTAMAVTRRNLVHVVVYLVLSFFGTAMLFYLLGAPMLAVLEVIIYAGAIMVLFLFVIMMIRVDSLEEVIPPFRQRMPVMLLGGLYLGCALLMARGTPGAGASLPLLTASPKELALYVFGEHWFTIEIVSLLLLAALVGVLNLGRMKADEAGKEKSA
ncbi:MAG: NADH-quinone oxidoreductase subunit J [Syntrophobacteraceae bacterium]